MTTVLSGTLRPNVPSCFSSPCFWGQGSLSQPGMQQFSLHSAAGMPSDAPWKPCSPRVQAIRSGNYPVLASGHILVLNWNRQTIPLLRQLALVQREQSGVLRRRSVFKRSKVDAVDGSFLADRWAQAV